MLENSVRRKVLNLASSYNSTQRSRKILLYTPCMTPQASLSSKPSMILLGSGWNWIHLESFSLANNDFKNRPFLKNYPVNQNSFHWNKFRLSLPIVTSTLSHSTHFWATCKFDTDGLVTTDYLRAKTTDCNILLLNRATCVKMEYINIRGYDCYNCNAKISKTKLARLRPFIPRRALSVHKCS
mgnify:CR=1 FL=1